MIAKKYALVVAVLVAVVLVSGCTQGTKPTMTTSPSQAPSVTTTGSPSPTADALNSGLQTNDELESDAANADLNTIDSDLGEVQTGL